jgi:hypothetical protein
MAGRRVNPYRVKIHRSYTARKLADCLGICKNTVRHWQRHGLAPIDDRRPSLFNGAAVRAFLVERNRRRKWPCPAGTIYCFRCREPRKPVATSVEYLQMTAGGGNLRAPCGECGTVMHRRVRRAEIQSVLPGVLVQITEASRRLSERPDPSSNCVLRTERAR